MDSSLFLYPPFFIIMGAGEKALLFAGVLPKWMSLEPETWNSIQVSYVCGKSLVT